MPAKRLLGGRSIVFWLSALLALGFAVTSLAGYQVSKAALRTPPGGPVRLHGAGERSAEEDLAEVRRTLYVNLAVGAAITSLVLLLANLTLDRYQRRLRELAATDPLTGLLNRQALDLLFVQAVRERKRRPAPMALLRVELDHLADVNDRHGHLAGDRVLEAAARLLRAGVREADLVCRWGGEEFLLLLKDCDEQGALALAEKLRRRTEAARIPAGGSEPVITLSVGVTGYGPDDTPDTALARAGAALAAAQEGGRNRVCAAPSPAPVRRAGAGPEAARSAPAGRG